jgi:sugar lactone lactonase YvrE
METKLLTGIVQSGEPGSANLKALPGVPVIVYEATAQEPLPVGTATTDAEGSFELPMEQNQSERIFYAVATVEDGVELIAVIGHWLQSDKPAWNTASPSEAASGAAANTQSDTAAESSEQSNDKTASITINELTTVAAAFSMAQFIQNGAIGGDGLGLQLASLMNDNLVDKRTGASSAVLLNPPNADETNSLRSTRSLANLLAACVNNVPDALSNLFAVTTPPVGGAPPTNTFEALFNIARYPFNNVNEIYTQSQAWDAYSPSLDSAPADAWTIAVKVNDTGSINHLFGGPANIAFDKNGYAWVSNNVVQGTPNSGRFAVVLKPNGKPADGKATLPSEGSDGLPKSPLFGGGLIGGGFGVDIDTQGNIWFSNFGWGDPCYYPLDGGVAVFNPSGEAQSPAAGYIGCTYRVQATVSDAQNNIWNSSFGTGRVVVFLEGNPQNTLYGPVPDGGLPFGIAIAADGSAWVTSSTGLWAYTSSSISRFKINKEKGTLELLFFRKFGQALKGLSIDSKGNIWIPSGGDDVVYVLDSEGTDIGKFAGGGINGPWGTAIDGNDNVWVANFGKMLPTADYTDAKITNLAGASSDNPSGYKMGDPISPTGYSLPTAGAPVRLRNGELLYGEGSEPSYSPLMRMTSVIIDQAGNVWAVNNWKPNFDIDAPTDTGNPGGDGIVIFVGLAKPPRRT